MVATKTFQDISSEISRFLPPLSWTAREVEVGIESYHNYLRNSFLLDPLLQGSPAFQKNDFFISSHK